MDLSGLLEPILAAGGLPRPAPGAPLRVGAGDTTKAGLAAALARDAGGPVLMVVAKEARARDLVEELGAWLGAAVGPRVRLYPQRDRLPYERGTEEPWDTRARLETIGALGRSESPAHGGDAGRGESPVYGAGPPIIVASVEAIAQRTLAPDVARSAFWSLAVGARLTPEDLLRRLLEAGYAIEPLVEAPGQAARRGGIVDLFAPQTAAPARVEFFGPAVESIRAFDPETQRSRERLTSITLGLATEFSPDRAAARYLAASLDFRACTEEAAGTIRDELETLAAGGVAPERSFLPALLSPFSLLDHLAAGSTVILDEPIDLSRALDEYVAETATMRIEREARGELPIGLPAAQSNWHDLQRKLAAHAVVELLRFGAEMPPSPAAPLSGGKRGGHRRAGDGAAYPSATAGERIDSSATPQNDNDEGTQSDSYEGPQNDGYEGPQNDGLVIRPPFVPAPGFGGRIRLLAREVKAVARKGAAVVIVSQQAPRLNAVLGEEGVGVGVVEAITAAPAPGSVQVIRGSLPHGWHLRPVVEDGGGESPAYAAEAATAILLLTDAEVFGFVKQRRALRTQGPDRSSLIADLSPGDYVVHIEHGIARFNGLVVRTVEGTSREFLELGYAEGDRLFVPVEQSNRVARYVGPGEYHPALTRLGSGEWTRARERVRRAVADVAQDLLDLYASRQLLPGHAFSPDTPWQQELEASFPYVETADQLVAINSVKADMEAARPMDRLICGDVGYGKTEVAVRAAFKAVMDGFQVAVLVPTTVLAQQHFTTFKERLASLPARVEMLSRFLSDKEARVVVLDTAGGGVDILIGTHRILQKDMGFKKLGLVIIDEEQRFGVAHKERLKQMRQEVDVLTLSATPIPRTLHMSLVGIRDLSNMMTPPEDRLPIRTYVLESDDAIIREAIMRELERGGQVFFVHNRVFNIELITERIRRLVPEANIGIGHGQMHEDQLEKTMLAFTAGEIDVLVCTTIIESGLDIPNANTIIINQADKLGLAQLYQLRGRVGRGAARAYAYLLYERGRALSETAQRRLQAIFEATELGAGFQIALHDLEIRGAGNLLGAEQSGHMAAVGFDLYVRMLGDAVERLKALQRGEKPPPPALARPAVSIDLPITAHLPDAYVPDLNLRLALYQRLSRAEKSEEVDAIEAELVDRFGPPPPAAKNLLWVCRLRLLATESGAGAIQVEGDQIVLRLLPGREIDRGAYPRRVPGLASVTAHQVRLDREALGEGWREGVVRALVALQGVVVGMN